MIEISISFLYDFFISIAICVASTLLGVFSQFGGSNKAAITGAVIGCLLGAFINLVRYDIIIFV